MFNIYKNISIIVGGTTGKSYISFYRKRGITTIGLEWNRKININDNLVTIFEVKFHINPSYKNIFAGAEKAPMNLFMSLKF